MNMVLHMLKLCIFKICKYVQIYHDTYVIFSEYTDVTVSDQE